MGDNQIEQPQLNNPIEPPQTFIWRWLPTIVGIAIVVFVGGGVIAYQAWWSKPAELGTQESVVATEFSDARERVGVDETANWKTYKNEKYGFEVKVPEDWLIIEPQGDQEEFYGLIIKFQTADTEALLEQGKLSPGYLTNLSIYTESIVSGGSAEDLMLESGSRSGNVSIFPFFDEISRIKVGNTNIDGREAYEYITVGLGTSYAILVNNNGEFYSLAFIRTPSKEQLPEIEKAVLSTFKFTR